MEVTQFYKIHPREYREKELIDGMFIVKKKTQKKAAEYTKNVIAYTIVALSYRLLTVRLEALANPWLVDLCTGHLSVLSIITY